MIDRKLKIDILSALRRSPTVALLGPRQVGKTTLALSLFDGKKCEYLDLEDKLDREKVKDIKSFYNQNKGKLIILDEIQLLPEIFSELRGIIDKEKRENRKVGLFLFLGSSSLDLLKQSAESLAGRIAYLELHTLNVIEYGNNKPVQLNELWLRGGFPDSLLSPNIKDSFSWRRDFVRTYLQRDIPQHGVRIPAETLERFWIMLAHHQGGIFNASQLANSLEVKSKTVSRYLDLMVDLLLVRRLKPWTFNEGKRLVKAPKVYVRDSGITHVLLNIKSVNNLLGHPVVGGSWEGFVIENILSVVPSHVRPYYYRTSNGAEIDLILEISTIERWAIEIKRNSAPSISKGFHIACSDIKANRKLVVYSGTDTFSMGNEVTAISLLHLMQELVELD